VKQNRDLVLNFLKGYMDGIHYMLRRKYESLQVLYKYFQNSDTAAIAISMTRPPGAWKKISGPMPVHRFHYEMAAPMIRGPQSFRPRILGSSLVEEIRRSDRNNSHKQ
jgi:hypothetical protein